MTDDNRGFRPRAMGEIAIRCRDMTAMADFYTRVIGLDPLSGNQSGDIRFFRIGEGFGGHTAVLALFRDDAGRSRTGAESSLHHIALSLPLSEQQAVMDWYDRIGQRYNVQVFGWIGWRGIFTKDPEGNTVELVAYDAALKESAVT